jgi:hypothetical protein
MKRKGLARCWNLYAELKIGTLESALDSFLVEHSCFDVKHEDEGLVEHQRLFLKAIVGVGVER